MLLLLLWYYFDKKKKKRKKKKKLNLDSYSIYNFPLDTHIISAIYVGLLYCHS